MRKEHDETISELESELTKERKGKTELLSKIVKMEFEVATLERELESARAKNDGHGSGTTSNDQQISDLRQKVQQLEEQVDAHSQTTKEVSNLRERALQDKEDECAALVRSLKKNHEMVLSEQEDAFQTKLRDAKKKLDEAVQTKEDYKTELRDAKRKYEALSHYTPSQIETQEFEARKDREATFLQQISDLQRRVQKLQEKDEDHSQKLLEASWLHERALQEKEEECALLVRTLKKNHEAVLSELEDTHRIELRDVKKKLEESLQANEESYLDQLSDAKKKEQDLMERESALLKQLEDTEERTSSTIMKQKNDELETILKQKNDEFEQRISAITVEKDELQLEIQRIRKDSDGTNLVITGLEEQLSNCNKEIDKQRRKHRSEMNKLMNTLELQQKKEGRLQSHIQSLERQIEDMVNDYESRLQDAFYSQM
jgi:chromosome segregation ATPase